MEKQTTVEGRMERNNNTSREMLPVLDVPYKEAAEALRAHKLVEDVETKTTSDFMHATVFVVEIPRSNSYRMAHDLRKLGLYIESVETVNDTDILYLRRLVDMLREMATKNVNQKVTGKAFENELRAAYRYVVDDRGREAAYEILSSLFHDERRERLSRDDRRFNSHEKMVTYGEHDE